MADISFILKPNLNPSRYLILHRIFLGKYTVITRKSIYSKIKCNLNFRNLDVDLLYNDGGIWWRNTVEVCARLVKYLFAGIGIGQQYIRFYPARPKHSCFITLRPVGRGLPGPVRFCLVLVSNRQFLFTIFTHTQHLRSPVTNFCMLLLLVNTILRESMCRMIAHL